MDWWTMRRVRRDITIQMLYKQRSWSMSPTIFMLTLKTLLFSSFCCKSSFCCPASWHLTSIYVRSFKIPILKKSFSTALLCHSVTQMVPCNSTVILKSIIRKQKKRQWLQDRQRLSSWWHSCQTCKCGGTNRPASGLLKAKVTLG